METSITGAEILLRSLSNHGVDTIFGYPGSCVMAVLDSLYTYDGAIRHVLVRHEQGAVHAAQGYAQVSGKVGVALLTSGPGATNTVTGIADAMANSTPLLIITGQVHSTLLGTDAFQEVDIIGVVHSITKWTYQIGSANEISSAIAHAFYIASTGRPGPVLLDITKDAQMEKAVFLPQKVDFIRSYNPSSTYEQSEILNPSLSRNEKSNVVNSIIGMLENIEEDLLLVLDTDDYSSKSNLSASKSIIRSAKFGTMGFGLPAAIGAKFAAPNRSVCLIVGASQFQATIQELGVVMQLGIDLKIILLNNEWEMKVPCFIQLMDAYGINYEYVEIQESLLNDFRKVFATKGSCVLEIQSEVYSKIPKALAQLTASNELLTPIL